MREFFDETYQSCSSTWIYGPAESKAAAPVPENTGLATLGKLGFSGSLFLGSWVPDVMAHGGEKEPVLPATEAERIEWGKKERRRSYRW